MIAVEHTPNPRSRKFLPGRHLSSIPREFTRAAQGSDPLVRALFEIADIQTVLVSEDAISVTVTDEAGWDGLTDQVGRMIDNLLSASFLATDADRESTVDMDFDEADAVVVETIRDLIDTRIRPAVARDGGDIVFRSYRDGILGLEMRGACSGCPSSATTLQSGIRGLMLHFVPEIRDVVAV
ncbi:NifU family protein [Agrobacterium rubi]|nr:NifU family protein [Agrobacterium rubi]NTF23894.1 NifU family protein [Agrobacterium rubi]